MKLNKKVLALALAAFVATGTATISAANDGDNNKPCTEQTTCKKGDKKECKKGKKDKNGEGRHEGKGRKGHANLFNGVELTADQQTAIKNLREKRQSAEKKARENNREAFMTELKGILTPEQFKQVEENAAKMKEVRDLKSEKGDKGQRPNKDGKPMNKRPVRK